MAVADRVLVDAPCSNSGVMRRCLGSSTNPQPKPGLWFFLFFFVQARGFEVALAESRDRQKKSQKSALYIYFHIVYIYIWDRHSKCTVCVCVCVCVCMTVIVCVCIYIYDSHSKNTVTFFQWRYWKKEKKSHSISWPSCSKYILWLLFSKYTRVAYRCADGDTHKNKTQKPELRINIWVNIRTFCSQNE